MTRDGADQEPPFHGSTEPDSSAAMQKVAVGQEIDVEAALRIDRLGRRPGLARLRTQRSAPLTMAQRSAVGQAMAAAWAHLPLQGAAGVQGDGSSDQPFPSQSSTEVPTTARHIEEVGQVIPTRPRSVGSDPTPFVPKVRGSSQLPSTRERVAGVVDHRAERRVGAGHRGHRVRRLCPGRGRPGCPAGPAVEVGSGAGGDQSVPSPVLTWPDPSTITQRGPPVQAIEGRSGRGDGCPVTGAGK